MANACTGFLTVDCEAAGTNAGSQQHARLGGGGVGSFAGAGFSSARRQQCDFPGCSAAPAVGSKQHQPIGAASSTQQRCTRIPRNHDIIPLWACASRFVKRIMDRRAFIPRAEKST